MVSFPVDDMTCGHCVGTITKAVNAVDTNARVNIDLAKHVVDIESPGAGTQQLGAAISEAGYTPVPLAGAILSSAPSVQRNGGCCG